MKKTITIMLLLMMAGSVSADLVLKEKRGLYVCPNVLTKSGKGVVYAFDYEKNEITIYSSDFFVDKTIRVPVQEYQSGSFTEEAIVTITGVNVVPETEYGSKNYSTYRFHVGFEAESQEDMINKLEEYVGYGYTFTAFTDPLGNPACYSEESSFYCESLFGKQYPERWYALIEGMIYEISTYSDFYTPVYNEESAVWTRTEETITTNKSSSVTYFYEIQYEGVSLKDGNSMLSVTQTLFNDDDKWEFLVQDYSGPTKVSYSSTRVKEFNDDGTITLTRYGNVSPEDSGYAVYNEDGTKLGNIIDNRIEVVNGKPYVKCHSSSSYDVCSLYSIENLDGNIDLIEAVRAKSDRRLDAKRGIVTVDIDAEQAGGEVVVSTADGRVMASKKVGVGQKQVNDQPLPTGIYIVSLLKNGKVVESEKYLVQ